MSKTVLDHIRLARGLTLNYRGNYISHPWDVFVLNTKLLPVDGRSLILGGGGDTVSVNLFWNCNDLYIPSLCFLNSIVGPAICQWVIDFQFSLLALRSGVSLITLTNSSFLSLAISPSEAEAK